MTVKKMLETMVGTIYKVNVILTSTGRKKGENDYAVRTEAILGNAASR
jgi:hypothetical protein